MDKALLWFWGACVAGAALLAAVWAAFSAGQYAAEGDYLGWHQFVVFALPIATAWIVAVRFGYRAGRAVHDDQQETIADLEMDLETSRVELDEQDNTIEVLENDIRLMEEEIKLLTKESAHLRVATKDLESELVFAQEGEKLAHDRLALYETLQKSASFKTKLPPPPHKAVR